MVSFYKSLAAGRLLPALTVRALWLWLVLVLAPAPLQAGEMFAVDLQILEGGQPVPGVFISIDYYQAETDKSGHAFFELFEGLYEIHIAITKGAAVITEKIAVTPEQREFVIDVAPQVRSSPTRALISSEVLATGVFDDFPSLERFWQRRAEAVEEALGEVRVAFDLSGRFLVLAGPRAGTDPQSLDGLLARADAAGFTSSFPLAWESVAGVLLSGQEFSFETLEGALLEALRAENSDVRQGARNALAALGQAAVPGLLGAFSGQDYQMDLGALIALSRIKDWEAEPAALDRLRAPDWPYQDRVMETQLRNALRAASDAFKLSSLGYAAEPRGVVAFQKEVGLAPDGILGPSTRGALNERLIASVAKTEEKPWAGYKMAVYALDVEQQDFETIKKMIRAKGAEDQGGFQLYQRPSWLALRSTVFYYSRDTAGDARGLATALGDALGVHFDVERGAGLGVRKGDERSTFFVHLIGQSKTSIK